MRNATDVVVAGCSAGGVQTLVNLDHLASYLPRGTRVLGLPDSGYLFPYRGPGQCDYEPHMASTFALMNASWAVPPQCLEQFQGRQPGGREMEGRQLAGDFWVGGGG